MGDRLNQTAWIETLVVSLLSISVTLLIYPNDPFLLQGDFPWLLMAPLFLALRHGFAFGFISQLFFIALIIGAWRMDWAGVSQFPTTVVFGSLIVTVLAGEFSDLWKRRLGKMEVEDEQRNRRMEEFTRSYHLLKLSHDQLAEQMAGSSVSLRQAIAGVRTAMLKGGKGTDSLATESERIMALFRRYGAVQLASLYRVSGQGLNDLPLAKLGEIEEDIAVLRNNAMVKESLKTGEMISVLSAEKGLSNSGNSHVLAIAPIRDLSGNIRALLIIYQIPFLKFNNENLSLIAVMGSYLGDLLHELEKELQNDEEARASFLFELDRSIRYARQFGMNARLVTVELPNSTHLEDLLSLSRSLDKVWLQHNRGTHPVVLWLMPFSDDYVVAGFQTRINLWAQKRFTPEDGESPVIFHAFAISGQDVTTVMDKIRCVCDLVDS